MYDFLLIGLSCIFGILAHIARNKRWLEWALRSIILLIVLTEGILLFINGDLVFNRLPLAVAALSTLLLLSMPLRQRISLLLSSLDVLITGELLLWLALAPVTKGMKIKELFAHRKIFVPTSFPHLMALFIYITTVACLISNIRPESFEMPNLESPLCPVRHLLSYNGIELVVLSFCGIGICVSRSYKESLARLSLVKPRLWHILIAFVLIVGSFAYDAYWAIFTHHLLGQDLAMQLSGYTPSIFTLAGSFAPSVILAMATTLCIGIGEEILIRGALQPVVGILPSALLLGLLYGQFALAPIFIVKLVLWSIVVGWIKRYTNTTTTIIGHAGFNLTTMCLYAVNP